MDEKAKLPSMAFPAEGRKLLKDFQFASGLDTLSEVICLLLAESPRLVEYARQNGRTINFKAAKRGGYRERKPRA